MTPMIKLHHTLLALALVMGTLPPSLAQAKDWIKPGDERFKLGGGIFLQNFDTTVRVDDVDLGGTDINLEDDLGFEENDTTYWLGGYWRFASRHRFGVSYFQNKRDERAVLLDDIKIDGEIIPVGAGYDSEFKIQVLPVKYAYSFMKRDKFELSGSLGVHWYAVDFDFKGAAGISDIDVDVDVSVEADAPMPLIGLGFDYYATKRWTIDVVAEVFALELDEKKFNFQGYLFNTRLGTEYWFWNNFGAGAALNYFGLNVDVEDPDWRGKLEYSYWGPQIYLTTRF